MSPVAARRSHAGPTLTRTASRFRNPAFANEFLALSGCVSGIVTLIDLDGTCWCVAGDTDLGSQGRIGRPWFELVHPDDVAAARAVLAELLAGESDRGRLLPYRLRGADGDYVWVEPQVSTVRDPVSGDAEGLVLVEREAEERILAEQRTRAAQEEQRRRFEQLEHVNRELDRFAAVVAHDLAAPLLVVSNYTAMLGSLGLTPEQADYIARIGRTVKRMQRLIEDLRRFAVADAALELEDAPLGGILDEVLETLAPLIDERRARIVAVGRLPTVWGDRGQLTQLLQNLVSNAVKFGPDQGGEVRISAARATDGWRISVSDRGAGIALEDRTRIFEPFRRLRGTGQLPGTGLGLTICERVVANHGGQLALDSLLGVGSTFTFTLPDRGPSS